MVANELRFWINFALSIARDIAIGRNLKLFLQVRYHHFSFCLWWLGLVLIIHDFRLLLHYGLCHSLAVSSIFLHWSILVSFVGPSFICNQQFKYRSCCSLCILSKYFCRGPSQSFSSYSV